MICPKIDLIKLCRANKYLQVIKSVEVVRFLFVSVVLD
jgi:hypothetical protein